MIDYIFLVCERFGENLVTLRLTVAKSWFCGTPIKMQQANNAEMLLKLQIILLRLFVGCDCAATKKPQRMVPFLLHLVPVAGRVLRAQHVRRRCHRELSQVSRESGAGREGASRGEARQETRPETQKYANLWLLVAGQLANIPNSPNGHFTKSEVISDERLRPFSNSVNSTSLHAFDVYDVESDDSLCMLLGCVNCLFNELTFSCWRVDVSAISP